VAGLRWLTVLTAAVLLFLPLERIQLRQLTLSSTHQITARHGPALTALRVDSPDFSYVGEAHPSTQAVRVTLSYIPHKAADFRSIREEHPVFRIRPPPSL